MIPLSVPNISGNEQWNSGNKTFRLSAASNNSTVPGEVSTVAEEIYIAAGQLDTIQETILSVRNARVEMKQEFQEQYIHIIQPMKVVLNFQ